MSDKLNTKINQITTEIQKSLKTLEELTVERPILTEKESSDFNYEVLEKLENTANALEIDILFFNETKKLSQEIQKNVISDYNSLDLEARKNIIEFVEESYQKPQPLQNVESLDQEEFKKVLIKFDNDIDGYLLKLNKKLEELKESIKEEEENLANLEKISLKEELEAENKQIELDNDDRKNFNQELEKLKKLESELETLVLERQSQSQIEEMRDILSEKIS